MVVLVVRGVSMPSSAGCRYSAGFFWLARTGTIGGPLESCNQLLSTFEGDDIPPRTLRPLLTGCTTYRIYMINWCILSKNVTFIPFKNL